MLADAERVVSIPFLLFMAHGWRILIFDNELSSVDAVAEERILDGLAEVLPGRPALLGVAPCAGRAARGRIFVVE